MIENFSLNQPKGAVLMDIGRYTDQTTNNVMYNSILTMFLDEQGETGISFMTDVHSTTYLECIEKTLKPLGNLYASVGAHVTVFELNSKNVICTVDLNELFPTGFDVSAKTEDTQERPKFLH